MRARQILFLRFRIWHSSEYQKRRNPLIRINIILLNATFVTHSSAHYHVGNVFPCRKVPISLFSFVIWFLLVSLLTYMPSVVLGFFEPRSCGFDFCFYTAHCHDSGAFNFGWLLLFFKILIKATERDIMLDGHGFIVWADFLRQTSI